MKHLLAMFVALALAGVYLFNVNYTTDGRLVGSKAGTAYCNMIKLQNTPGIDGALRTELDRLKQEHNNLMKQGFTLRGEERTMFTSTYSSMVSHCN